ncbi:MAG: hypothetical protein ACXAC7_18455 [Candidatus Hodarchaeales archaeon]|jgi:rRNA-processing protein FCF1
MANPNTFSQSKKTSIMPSYITEGKILILIDTNVFLIVLEKNWNLHRLIESAITENYYLICPKMIRQELLKMQVENKRANAAIRLADQVTKSLDESLFISPAELETSVDNQLISLAVSIPVRTIVLTQDIPLRNKLLNNNVLVLQLGYKKAKLYIP